MISLVWLTVEFKRKGRLFARETGLHNLIHDNGLHYILASAFAPQESPVKALPSAWYFGLDRRKEIKEDQTLKDAAAGEPDAEDYGRLLISENGQWIHSWQEAQGKSPRFTLFSKQEFFPNSDWGTVRNFFVTNAAEGNEGLLISSTPLPHAYPVDEHMSVAVDIYLDLREVETEKKK
jgi:hypothetical protein